MNCPKRYKNTSIPQNQYNRPSYKQTDEFLIVPCEATIDFLIYGKPRTPYMTNYSRAVLNRNPIHSYGTDTLMNAGIQHMGTDRGRDMKTYMEQYGKFVGMGEYSSYYTSVVKYVGWSLDLHLAPSYNLPIQKKLKRIR